MNVLLGLSTLSLLLYLADGYFAKDWMKGVRYIAGFVALMCVAKILLQVYDLYILVLVVVVTVYYILVSFISRI